VLKALRLDREERYPTARALGQDLARFVAAQGHPVGAADLEEFMKHLFPDRFVKRRQLMNQPALDLISDLTEQPVLTERPVVVENDESWTIQGDATLQDMDDGTMQEVRESFVHLYSQLVASEETTSTGVEDRFKK